MSNNTLNQALGSIYPNNPDPSKDPALQGPSNNWESLEQQYNIHANMFAGYHRMTAMLLNPTVQLNLQNINKTANLVKGLSADVQMLNTKTQRVHRKHAGRTGFTQDIDENFAIIQIFQEYAALIDQHQLLVLPVVAELNEHLNYALNQISIAQAQANQPQAVTAV